MRTGGKGWTARTIEDVHETQIRVWSRGVPSTGTGWSNLSRGIIYKTVGVLKRESEIVLYINIKYQTDYNKRD